MKNNNDLTTGSISKKLILFTIPLLISVAFQQIYNLADSIIAGKFLGENSFAAISNSYEITLVFLAVSVGSNIGCSVIFSQLFGAKKHPELKCAISTAFICGAVLCALMTLLGIIFIPTMLSVINTPDAIFDESSEYLRIYILGFSFMFFYNIVNGTFSSMGDSATPLIFLACSSVLNIILDILMVGMGVAGIAWATFISQMIACIFSLIALTKKAKKLSGKTPTLFSSDLLKKIANVAIPSILQQSVISVGNIFLQGVINSYGTAVIAGYGAGVKLNNFTINTMTTLGNGISAFSAQNIGAKKFDRVRSGFYTGLKIGGVVCFVFSIIYLIFAEPLIGAFIDSPTDEAIKTGCQFLRILSPFYFCICIKLVSDGVLRGGGAMKFFLIATFTDLVIRVVLSYILSSVFESVGIWLSWPIGWIIGTVLSLYFNIKGKWKRNII